MTIDKQIELLTGKEEYHEVLVTLIALRGLMDETQSDSKKHRWHAMVQRLSGARPGKPTERQVNSEPVMPELQMGDVFYYSNTKMKFVTTRGIDIIAMDDTGSERTIPKSRWKDIIITRGR